MRKTLFLGAAILALVACGGKSMKEVTATANDKAAVTNVMTSTQGLQGLKANGADTNALNGFQQIQANAQQLVGAHAGGALALDGKADYTGCTTESGGTITYNNCQGSGQTINGTISVNGDNYAIDLKISFTSGGYAGDVTYQGSITVTNLAVTGSLSFDYEISSVTYSIDVSYNNLVLSADCNQGPIGGSLEVDQSTKIKGLGSIPGAGGSSSTSVRVDFGPACGDLKMFAG